MVRTRDDDGARVGSVPLFTPILPPKITSISHDFLAKLKIRRGEYEAELRARSISSGEDYDVAITPIMESFDVDLLDTVKNKTLPDIKTLFRSQLHLRMSVRDIDASVLGYFNEFGKIARANGLTGCFSGIAGTREKRKRLVASFHPEALKAEVKQCVRFTHKTAASNPRELFELIVEKATEHERQYQRLKDKKKSWKIKPSTAPGTKPSTVPANKNAKPSARQPPSPCPECQELHWTRDSPKATEVEKEAMRKELREANQAKRARLKRFGEDLPAANRVVAQNGVLQLPYCPDGGSDYTIISRSHWNQLNTRDPTAGPVEPVNAVDVLIADAEDDEFIVGNDLLTSLGIDVDRQLEMLACRDEDETSGDTIELEADDSKLFRPQ
ncbi:unnamed protein product [Phytophthora fragariaefolia]|uniref:Unnamed protein product n=1 Tax=Phytophthora fragariaefolia TaxID=1490495 RepID=A0A9W6U740_9STRA|nr:unnamed protein product [Phytophthora fragariaefolia]